jgi:nitroimidazol reductase NimA-like FMN-containing flavoprotein (pyridoxamine 5'-phosphate oxidase superfamily)
MDIRTLSNNECSHLLTAHRVGFLACSKAGQPYVIPIHYAYADTHIYAFSMPGKKIDWMRANPLVSLLVDQRGEGRGWKSVIAEGRYEELPDHTDHKVARDHAWALLSKHNDWWEPGALKPVEFSISDHSQHVFFRILVDRVSGREATG